MSHTVGGKDVLRGLPEAGELAGDVAVGQVAGPVGRLGGLAAEV
jgi:hypothetical protein